MSDSFHALSTAQSTAMAMSLHKAFPGLALLDIQGCISQAESEVAGYVQESGSPSQSTIYWVAHRRCLDLVRKNQSQQRANAEFLNSSRKSESCPDDNVLQKERRARQYAAFYHVIRGFVLRCECERRFAIKHAFECYVHGMDRAAIAALLDVTPRTVGRHLEFALNDIHERIQAVDPELTIFWTVWAPDSNISSPASPDGAQTSFLETMLSVLKESDVFCPEASRLAELRQNPGHEGLADIHYHVITRGCTYCSTAS